VRVFPHFCTYMSESLFRVNFGGKEILSCMTPQSVLR
jgi:hypothetical protein